MAGVAVSSLDSLTNSLQLVANLLQYYSRPCVAAFVKQSDDC